MEKSKEQTIEITADGSNRLDVLLAEKLCLSRTMVQKIIKETGVFRIIPDRKIIHKPGYQTSSGEVFKVTISAPREVLLDAEDIALDVLFEDDDLLVIDKPAGLMVHPAGKIKTGTLVNALLSRSRNLSHIGGYIRPGIVHRLDKDTSGVMVIAKNDHTHHHLSEQFRLGRVKKTYLALVQGILSGRKGMINANIGRGHTDRTKMKVSSNRGRKAVTEYEVIKQYRQMALLRLFPRTGRTHQIRVHLAFIGHPIIGDWKYGQGKAAKAGPRQLLHAESLSFYHPVTGEHLRFQAELPADFKEYLK